MRLRVGAATHIGRVRALNEDVYLVRAERGLFVVCDGVGGAPAGEVASQMAVDSVLTQLGGANFGPSWTPDGKRIIFASNYQSPRSGNFDLFLVNPD